MSSAGRPAYEAVTSMSDYRIFKLRLNCRKTVESIDFLAQQWPGITQYYVGKILYLADKQHCIDWGRPITGDRYVAMEHGPVPSRVYDLLKTGSGEDDELLDYLIERVALEVNGSKVHVYSRGSREFPSLSETDKSSLISALEFCQTLTFAQLRDYSHNDLAWRVAAENPTNNAPAMDLSLWFDEETRIEAGEYLREHAKFGVRDTPKPR